MFAGRERRTDVGTYIRQLATEAGLSVVLEEVDVCRGPDNDLLDESVWFPILVRLRAGGYDLAFVTPPCSTFSRAQLNKGRGPPPLRSSNHPWGFPCISGPRRKKIEDANTLIKRSFAALEAAGISRTPWLLEFPEDLGKHRGMTPASIWQFPSFGR